MSDSPRILIFTDWFTPGFKAGGPIRSIYNLVQLLGPQAWVVTGDRDLGDDMPYDGIQLNQWTIFDNGAHVMYCSPDKAGKQKIRLICEEFVHDTWYMNSMFSLRFTIEPLWWNKNWKASNKLILAPRGMLHPEALKIKSFKKNLFLRTMRFLHFFDRVLWHATGEDERSFIRQHFGLLAKVHVLENVPTLHPFRSDAPSLDEIRVVMISRLSEEKGVLEGLQSWFGMDELKNVRLHIIGPKGDENYAKKVVDLIQEHKGWQVSYLDAMSPARCVDELNQSHFLFSPTRGENYGHAIAEALLMGVPVIVTNTTPWKGLEEKGWGWDYESSSGEFSSVMKKVIALSELDYLRIVDQLKLNRAEEEAKWRGDLLQSYLFEKH
jgi:glycosyltransferase involved in cell wall biosynthesis